MIMTPYFHPELLRNHPLKEMSPYFKNRVLDYTDSVIRKFVYFHKDSDHMERLVLKAIEPFIFDVRELEKR